MGVLSSLLNLRKAVKPGGLGEAAEFAFSSVFHPEQILSKSNVGKQLYGLTVKLERESNLAKQFYKKETSKIIEKYGLKDENKLNEFLQLLEHPYHHGGAFPTPQEMARYTPEIKAAVVEHIDNVTNPIWEIAKTFDKEIGYQPGYFTHFPVKALRSRATDESKRVKMMLDKTPDTPEMATIREGYKRQLVDLEDRTKKYIHTDEQLNALRYHILPSGGKFGPLDEARKSKEWLGYRLDYKDVMSEYIDGAFRKVFLDKYMPMAQKLVSAEPNPALRQYMFDYVTAQRGALASKRKLFLNEALSKVFPDPEAGYRGVASTVDWLTRFQYLTKIGLSWFRFPFINMTQPLLTTYPMVGGKIFTQAISDALTNPSIWREARDVGVIFEANLRKGITEVLGHGTKLSKVERGLSWPATLSEEINRVISYAAGLRQGRKLNLQGEKLTEFAINLVNRTQFLYSKAGMPLIMSSSPMGRLLFQFRTFTSNYVNYLTQLVREKNWPGLSRAIGSLGVLAGSSAIPFKIWDRTREGLLRNTGKDIGEFNPIEFLSEELFGMNPGINFGGSLEPFNIPTEVSQIFGPTLGPVLKLVVDAQREPDRLGELTSNFLSGQVPPLRAGYRGLMEKQAVTPPTIERPKGRVIGERSLPETLFLRPSLEATRHKYIELIANAYAGGRPDIAAKLILEGRNKYKLKLDVTDLGVAKQRAAKLRGVRKPTAPSQPSFSETTTLQRFGQPKMMEER